MSSLKDVVSTAYWPGVNSHAFWSLCERVDGLFILESSDELRAEYVFRNDVDGKLLKAPFEAIYNIYCDSWSNVAIDKATLYLNEKALEICEGPEINFETFTEKSPMPVSLLGDDEMRIVLRFANPTFIPKTIGSARVMRFTWDTKSAPFVVATTCDCAVMYDGHQLRAVSHVEDDDSSDDEDIKELVRNITGPNPDPEMLERALSMDASKIK
jgi:hypothetical protein